MQRHLQGTQDLTAGLLLQLKAGFEGIAEISGSSVHPQRCQQPARKKQNASDTPTCWSSDLDLRLKYLGE